jgi:excisionase family DNA binding protein
MANAQSPESDPAAPHPPQLFGEGTGLEDVSFLTVAEVAGVMRVSKMTVYRMVHSGELTAVRVGRSFRVPAKAVREYLSGAYVGTDPAPGPL